MKPPIPSNEVARLESLRQYQILDSTREQAFDDLSFLASQVCGVPLAAISLVDSDRQWFKSSVGLKTTETPRDIAFCAHAILLDDVFCVPDALADNRFKDNPLVRAEPSIRFYAGAPLVTPDGYSLGTICTMDIKPRQLSVSEGKALLALARLTMLQLEMRRNTAHQTEVNTRLGEQIAEIRVIANR